MGFERFAGGDGLSVTHATAGRRHVPVCYTAAFRARCVTVRETVARRERRKLAKVPAQESVTYRMADYDDFRPHLANFFDAVRTRKPVVEDVVFGHNAALACHMANESYFRKTAVTWDEASKAIKQA